MMSLSKMVGTGRGNYYLNLAQQENYYLRGETQLTWVGSGTQRVGLSGPVKEREFTNALLGVTPDGRKVRNAGPERVSGMDVTLSADKTVSSLWSQSSPKVQRFIQRQVGKAALKALSYLEAEAGYTRRGVGGSLKEKIKFIAAMVLHTTARGTGNGQPAPQLHAHVVILNVAKTADGQTRTIDLSGIYKHQKAAGALFRAELAARLSRLGLRFTRDGWKVKVKGPKALYRLADAQSPRRRQIEERLRALGASSARAAEKAALATRKR
jgi:conjugative relaxase-like TrwC/TraI family protein